MTRRSDWDALIPPEEQERLRQDAAYMMSRLRGDPARPPAHWPPEQIAMFAAILADPSARSALLNEALRGFQRVYGAADAPRVPSDDGDDKRSPRR